MVFVGLMVTIVILDLLAIQFGADSREGFDDTRRQAPGFWRNEGGER
ncbi:MAG TPA: hypothetical protein VFY18_02085 [Candidatus Limnocylindrales bacterium]|nr:hypothetical protein [Candidatus Limnocylindrales bacterium]